MSALLTHGVLIERERFLDLDGSSADQSESRSNELPNRPRPRVIRFDPLVLLSSLSYRRNWVDEKRGYVFRAISNAEKVGTSR